MLYCFILISVRKSIDEGALFRNQPIPNYCGAHPAKTQISSTRVEESCKNL